MNELALKSTPTVDTHLETQAVLYPTLRYLVRLLPLNHRQVKEQLHKEAEKNPFLSHRTRNRELLLDDVVPTWHSPAAPEANLQEHLRGQITALNLPRRQREALIYLTQWLSPSGYLEKSPPEWAKGSPWSPAELEAVVPYLQNLDPPGVGARSLQECLLLQLQDQPDSLAALLVRNDLEAVATCVGDTPEAQQHREVLLQKLPPPHNLATLEAAIRQIQSLEPRPGRHYSHSPVATVTPDLKAEPQAQGWQVSLAYEVSQDFCLDEEAICTLRSSQANGKTQERRRVESLIQKAQSVLAALTQWQENLVKVGQFLVDRQQAFLESGHVIDLTPTSQQMIAQMVGLSDATISRIVRERYLLIAGNPSQIMPLQALCCPISAGGRTPQQIQHLIAQIVAEESPAQPYSDDQLTQLLKLRYGLGIARRTVVKYRRMAGIDSSHKRKLDTTILT